MVVCLCFIPLELFEGRICFFGKLRGGQSWWRGGDLKMVNRGVGCVHYLLGVWSKAHSLRFEVLRIQNALLLQMTQAPHFIVSYCQGESTKEDPRSENLLLRSSQPPPVVSEEMKTKEKIQEGVGTSVPTGPPITKGCHSERFEDGCKTAH